MPKTPTAETIERYREMLMTNPDTYKAELQRIREEFRQRAEPVFIQLDLDKKDKQMSEIEKKIAIKNSEEMICRLGDRVEWIDEKLADAEESQANLMGLNRPQRRRVEKNLRKGRAGTLATIQGSLPLADDPIEDAGDSAKGDEG